MTYPPDGSSICKHCYPAVLWRIETRFNEQKVCDFLISVIGDPIQVAFCYLWIQIHYTERMDIHSIIDKLLMKDSLPSDKAGTPVWTFNIMSGSMPYISY